MSEQQPDKNEWRVKMPPPCIACGQHHGGVNLELLCLRAEVLRLRGGK